MSDSDTSQSSDDQSELTDQENCAINIPDSECSTEYESDTSIYDLTSDF